MTYDVSNRVDTRPGKLRDPLRRNRLFEMIAAMVVSIRVGHQLRVIAKFHRSRGSPEEIPMRLRRDLGLPPYDEGRRWEDYR